VTDGSFARSHRWKLSWGFIFVRRAEDNHNLRRTLAVKLVVAENLRSLGATP